MPRVLVVDDSADVRLLLRRVLSADGWDVEEADGGMPALERLDRGEPPALVLLDVQMPDTDGWKVLAAIRASSRAAEVPVIMCTVRSLPADAERAWRLECDGYVSKPFDTVELQRVSREVAGRDRAARERARQAGLAEARDRGREAG